MSNPIPHPALARPVAESNDLLRLVGRIGASRHFRRTQRLRAFLEFVCREALDGNAENIHEQLIGHRAFGRSADYDPTSDNIVRVEARELRKRLEAYFADEGATEPIVIRVPKGGYVPIFEPAPETQPDLPLAAIVLPAAAPPSRGVGHRFLVTGLVALLLVSVGANVYQRLGRIEGPGVQAARESLPPLFSAFWSRIFEAERPALLSMADSNLSLLQDLRGEPVSFTDYTSGRYFASLKDQARKDEASRILSEIASRYYTSVADASTVIRLMMLNRDRRPAEIRYARDLNIRDLKSRNVILLGSSRSNPWVDLIDGKRRFHTGFDAKLNRAFLRDDAPESGNPSIYLCGPPGEKPYEAYGIVASVPNLDGTGHAILIAGTNMQGTEAAGDFLTNATAFEAFLKQIDWRPDRPLPVFEVVLKLVTMAGSSTSNQIFAYHVPKR